MMKPDEARRTSHTGAFRIAIVGGSLSTKAGGAPRSMAMQARALSKCGLDVHLFCGYSQKYPLTPERLGVGNLKVSASLLWGPSVLGFAPGMFFRFFRTLPQLDVVHLNGAWNLTTFICARLARCRHVPYIISCRGHFGAYHFARKPKLKRLLYLLLEKKNVRDAAGLHLTSRWECTTSNRVTRDTRVFEIPNPVDLADFVDPVSRMEARQSLSLGDDAFVVLCLGRLGKQKNPAFLVNAFADVSFPDAILSFVGPPEMDVKRKLAKQIRAQNLHNNVRFQEFVEGRERHLWYAAADVFALPSFDENFCIAAVEAVASGTLCLLSPNVGVIENLPTSHVVVRPLELQAWSRCLREFYTSRPPQRLVGVSVLDVFSEGAIGRQWLEVYKVLLQKETDSET